MAHFLYDGYVCFGDCAEESKQDGHRFWHWEDAGLEDHVMEWGDAGLEQYMRRHTDITEGDNMLSDVWPMTYITSQNGGIVDVTALRELNNLTEL